MSSAKKEDGSTKSFVEYKAKVNTSDTRVAQIASAGASAVGGSLLDLSENQKRWIVTGICLNKVVTPRLRKYIKSHMTKSYKKMKRSNNIDRQTFPTHLKNDGKHKLNYAAINNNQTMHGHTARLYDYKVTSPVDMAKLYLQTHMAKFSAFDESCDPSAVLGILCASSCFSSTILQTNAQDVRANVRNEWAHCNFADWTEFKFLSVFQKMDVLVRSLGLAKHDTDDIVEQLNDWMSKGVLLCMASDIDKDLLKVLYQEVSVLAKYSVDIHEDTINQLQAICNKINSTLQEFERRLVATEEDQKLMSDRIQRVDQDVKKSSDLLSSLGNEHGALHEEHTQTKHRLGELEEEHGLTLEDVKQLQENQGCAEDKIQRLEAKQTVTSTKVFDLTTQQNAFEKKQSRVETEVEVVKKDLTGLEETVQSLGEKIKEASSSTSPICFQAPNRNEYFSGRECELGILQDAFDVSKSSTACNKVFGISGLGGCGKTTLAAEYSWRCRSFYTGGVFWISVESETLFRNTITELAFTRDTFDSDFDQCLRATLASLSRVPLPFLLVVDNADELELSDNVRKLLSGHWMRESTAHVLVTTRRKAEELHEVANVQLSDFVTLECLARKEAVSFMQKRTNMTHAASDGESGLAAEDLNAVTELVDELGGLPLALEQAGSHIKALKCTYPQYLREFRKLKMKLIQQKKARPSSEEISKERLAVHTTWLMNFEYASQLAKESGLEELTSIVIDVSAYLNPDNIPCDFINQAYSMDEFQGEAEQTKVDPMVVGNIVDILTKFSLFQSKSRECLSVHRLVQQVIQSRCPEEKRGDVMLCGVRMLDFAFRNTKSPTDVLTDNSGQRKDDDMCMQESNSLVTWARLASNAVILKSHLKDYVSSHPQTGSKLLYTEETANVVGETAVYLSMSNQQTQAFESQTLMLKVLAGLDAQETNKTNVGLLENPVTVPLTDAQRRVLRLCSTKREKPETIHKKDEYEHVTVDQLRLKGNEAYSSGDYESAISTYSKAIQLSSHNVCKPVDVSVLYCNRSQCYLKLGKPTDALRDAEECVKRDPHSFKGFFRRALAMKMLFKEGREEYKLAFLASAAMAVDLNRNDVAMEAQRIFGADYCSAPVRVISSQDQWEEVTTDIARSSITSPWIIILRSGVYEFTENSRTNLGFARAIIIGYDNVEIKNAYVIMGPERSHHFENIVFDKANLQAIGSFVSCMRCTFQKGMTYKLSKCMYEPCAGCLFCHSNAFVRDSDLSSGFANLQAQLGSRLFVIQCILRDSAGGVLATNDGSFALVRDCKIHDHSLVSVEARDGASLVAEENELFHSKFAQGVCIGPKAASSRIVNNKIYGNKSFGILVIKNSKEIVIEGNEIFHNGEHGIMLTEGSSMVAHRNIIFENWFWGMNVIDTSSARVSENTIHNNKCGGIRVAPTTAKVVLFRNEVRDHNGPGILEGEAALGARKLHRVEQLPHTPPLMVQNIEMRNIEGQQHPKEKFSSFGSRCAFCHKTQSDGVELKHCTDCYKALYCSEVCQAQHWKKHKPLCKALKDKFSVIVDVTLPGSSRFSSEAGRVLSCFRRFHPDLKGIMQGPTPNRYSTKRFIIKVQTQEDIAYNPESDLTLYDQSTAVYFQFKSRIVYHIVLECGVLGLSKATGKKIFCHASFEEKGKKLRINLDELAPFQEW